MDIFFGENAHFLKLLEALGIGLVIGIERYKNRAENEVKSAGVRTFALIGLLGGVSSLVENPLLTSVTFASLVLMMAIGYWKETSKSIGLTTETTAMLTFWLGFLVPEHERLMLSITIVVVVLLMSKRMLHKFVKETISELEFYDTIKFLVVVFVVLPFLPNHRVGPFDFFNPYKTWVLVIIVSSLSFGGYILIRLLGQKGAMLSAMVGGLVSTTVVTVTLAQQSKNFPSLSRLYGVTAVLANSVQFPRLLILIWIVFPDLGRLLTIPMLAMFAVGSIGVWLLTRKFEWEKDELNIPLTNPYSFLPALKFAIFFVLVLFLVKLATIHLGSQGIFLASGLSGLADASAISLSLASMAKAQTIPLMVASWSVMIAVCFNALLKWILAIINGSIQVAFWLAGGLLTMLLTGSCCLFFVLKTMGFM